MAEKMKGMGGLSKMGSEMEKKPKAEPAPTTADKPVEGDGEVKTHTVTEHPDGHLESQMHDGTHTSHPDHMHMMAHMGHHMTGGDKHLVHHHDGMSIHSHGIHESGEHDGPHEHGSAEEAGQHTAGFMGDGEQEGQEPQDQGAEQEPAYGGMGQ